MLSSAVVLRATPSLPQQQPARHQQAPGFCSSPCHPRHHTRPLVGGEVHIPRQLSPTGATRHADGTLLLQLCQASTSGRDTPQLKATLFKTVTRCAPPAVGFVCLLCMLICFVHVSFVFLSHVRVYAGRLASSHHRSLLLCGHKPQQCHTHPLSASSCWTLSSTRR
jgi:hypothetical protein